MTTENIDSAPDFVKGLSPENRALFDAALSWGMSGFNSTPRAKGKKHPALEGWTTGQNLASDETAIRALIGKSGEANFNGMFAPLGYVGTRRVIAIDIDSSKPDYDPGNVDLEKFPETATQNTPSGGKHMFYTLPALADTMTVGQNIGGSTGIDYRCQGGGVAIYERVDWGMMVQATPYIIDLLPREQDNSVSVDSASSEKEDIDYDFTETELNNLEILLKGIDPDCSYEEWFPVLYACHNVSNGSPVVKEMMWEWCQSSKSKKHSALERAEFEDRWNDKKTTRHGWKTLMDRSENDGHKDIKKVSSAKKKDGTKATRDKTSKKKPGPVSGKKRRTETRQLGIPAPITGIPWMDDWRQMPEEPLESYPDNSIGHTRHAMETLGISVRYDSLNLQPILIYKDKHYEFKDSSRDILKRIIGEHFDVMKAGKSAAMTFTPTVWNSQMSDIIHCSSPYNPFEEFLRENPKWDGTSRLDQWLGKLFSTEGNRMVSWASKYMFLGAVQRQREPGCMLDEMPVLVGRPGLGKTAVVASLFPAKHRGFFGQGIDFKSGKKERVEGLQGMVVIEVGEIGGIADHRINDIKNFLSVRNDRGVRLAYRADSENMPRQCILVGTTNDHKFVPNDTSGNRRFVPVNLQGTEEGLATESVEGFMEKHRGQLWAEAIQRYENGERANLPLELRAEVMATSEDHRDADEAIEELIESQVSGHYGLEGKGVRLSEVYDLIGLTNERRNTAQITRNESKAVCKALRNCGFIPRNIYVLGKKTRVWENTRPYIDPDETAEKQISGNPVPQNIPKTSDAHKFLSFPYKT